MKHRMIDIGQGFPAVEFYPDADQVEEAKVLAMSFKGTPLQGLRSKVTGMVVQVVARDLYGAEDVNGYDYDLLKDGHKIDVKGKKINVLPRPHYVVAVQERQREQECEWYLFGMINPDLKRGWLLGQAQKEFYWNHPKLVERHPGDRLYNGHITQMHCHELAIKYLKQMRKV